MIYISEAHATDEWKLGNIVDINQHKNIQDRIDAAKNFIETYDWKIPTVVDSFDSVNAPSFENLYSAWPERYIIFNEGNICEYGAASNEYGFDRLYLKRNLRQFVPESRESLLQSNFDVYNDDQDEVDCVFSDIKYEFGDEPHFVPNQTSASQI